MIHPDCVHNTFSGKYIYHDRVLVLYEASKFPRIAQSMGIDLETFFKTSWYHSDSASGSLLRTKTLLAKIADEVIHKRIQLPGNGRNKINRTFYFYSADQELPGAF